MLVGHRRADHAVATEQDRHLLLVHHRRNLPEVGIHDLADAARSRRAEKLAEADLANRVAGRVDDEDQIEIGIAELGTAEEVDGLADGPEGRHGDHLALHHPASRILRIGEPLLDKHPVLGRKRRQDIVDLVLLQLLDDVHCIVGVQIGKLAGQRRHAHHLDDVVARVFVEIGERLGIEAVTEDTYQRRRPWRRKTFQKIRLVGRVKRCHKGARAVVGAFGNSRGDGRLHLRRQPIERRKPVAVLTPVGSFGHLGRFGRRLCRFRLRGCHRPRPSMAGRHRDQDSERRTVADCNLGAKWRRAVHNIVSRHFRKHAL